MSEWFVNRGGKITGPHALQQIRIGIKKGQLKTTAKFARKADGPWIDRRQFISIIAKEPLQLSTQTPTPISPEQPDTQSEGPKLTPPIPDVSTERSSGSSVEPGINFDAASALQPPSVPMGRLDELPRSTNPSIPGNFTASVIQIQSTDTNRRKLSPFAVRPVFLILGGITLIPALLLVGGLLMQASKSKTTSSNRPPIAPNQATPTTPTTSANQERERPGILESVIGSLPGTGLSAVEKQQLSAEIRILESELSLSEIRVDSVFQQQAARTKASAAAAAVLAKAFEAEEASVAKIDSTMSLADIGADTALQQIAIRLNGQMQLLGLAAVAQGASQSQVASVESNVSLNEISAETVNQQIAARLQGVVEMAAVFAQSIGVQNTSTTSVQSTLSINEISASNVYQQIAYRQSAATEMMELAARELGVADSSIANINSTASLDEVRADTVQQQIAARMTATRAMITLVCNSQLD